MSKPVVQTASHNKPTMAAPKSGVTVRMYRQGLGDCFLLAFPTTQPGQTFYMVIDCGVIIGTQDAEAIMTQVAEDIEASTGGDIHLLVITHEHWDHVSGFVQAEAVWRRMRIHHLWLAWTEDPNDELAKQLRKQFEKERAALQMALERAFDKQSMEHIAHLLSFFGGPDAGANDGNVLALSPSATPDPSVDEPSAAARVADSVDALAARGRIGTAKALETIHDIVRKTKGTAHYRRPGETAPALPKVKGVGDVSGVRIHILGPPRDEQALRRNRPSKRRQEVYTEGLALTPELSFVLALHGTSQLPVEEREFYERSFPFDAELRISMNPDEQNPQARAFFATHYGDEPWATDQARSSKEHQAQDTAWRRIDDDWLGAAGELALLLDSYTNNTSLVMAIELVSTKKVLLFVADAQVGNWRSWSDMHWQVDETAAEQITTADLLRRTVLYKVGHHGSHNATLRQVGPDMPAGLELMTNPNLVAMLPVSHVVARAKGWEHMPFRPLLQRLDEQTRHRIMRVDDAYPKAKPEHMREEDWQAFCANFHETELYMEYTVLE